MATHTEAGKSIECNKSSVSVRGISKNPSFVEIEGMRLFRYKSKISAIIKIQEELVPKIFKICESSCLDVNDVLEAPSIEINIAKRVVFKIESNFSSKHGIQYNDINSFTYAKIVIPWRFVTERTIECQKKYYKIPPITY